MLAVHVMRRPGVEMKHGRRKILVAGAVLLGALAAAAPALAVWTPGVGGAPRDVPTEVTMSGTGPGGAVTGFIGPLGTPSNPAVPYPTAIPAGFTALNEGFAGIIHAVGPGGTPQLQMYCIDIRTLTSGGFGYNLGTWSEANVTNVGFVARVLNDYFPHTPAQPAAAATNATKAAAVQAAIWYFADNYVLDLNDPLRPITESIVNTVRIAGPLPEPTPPPLNITPPSLTVDAGTDAGPFTIDTGPTGAKIAATGATMVASDGITIILNGATVPDNTQIFLRSTTPGAATVTVAAVEDVAHSHVYLYSGNITGQPAGQKLILAEGQRSRPPRRRTSPSRRRPPPPRRRPPRRPQPPPRRRPPRRPQPPPQRRPRPPRRPPPPRRRARPPPTATIPAPTTTVAAVAPEDTGSLPPTGPSGPPLEAVMMAALAVGAGGALVFLTRRRRAA